ncbi:unnamed protein product [Penicillium olsonii]|nr:unnamed protein product [Penicillium olsonii]
MRCLPRAKCRGKLHSQNTSLSLPSLLFSPTLQTTIMTKGFAAFSPQVEEVFDQIKETDTADYVFYEASAHDKKISVAESGKYKDYADFTAQFKNDTPRYAIVKVKYPAPTGGEERHKIVLITWVPEDASTHDKAYYTANKDHLYYSLEGISLHVQAHNLEEVAHATILKQFKVL